MGVYLGGGFAVSAIAFESVMEERRPSAEAGEVNCATCQQISDFNDEHRRGWCLSRRKAVSTWHPVKCSAFTPITWPRKLKVVWLGIVVYGS